MKNDLPDIGMAGQAQNQMTNSEFCTYRVTLEKTLLDTGSIPANNLTAVPSTNDYNEYSDIKKFMVKNINKNGYDSLEKLNSLIQSAHYEGLAFYRSKEILIAEEYLKIDMTKCSVYGILVGDSLRNYMGFTFVDTTEMNVQLICTEQRGSGIVLFGKIVNPDGHKFFKLEFKDSDRVLQMSKEITLKKPS